MNLMTLIQSKQLARISACWLLTGLMACGIAVRASKSGTEAPTAAPTRDTGFQGNAVKIRSRLSHTKVLQGSDGLVYMEVDMEAPLDEGKGRHRKPTDFVIVLDRSGSMADERKIDYAKRAVESLIRQLKDGDRFALVAFDNIIETPIPLTRAGQASKEQFLSTLRGLYPGGGTNLGGGLLAGIREIKDGKRISGQAQRLILLSDGLANEGITDMEELSRIASRSVSGEFAVSTIGVGLDFDERLMAALADHGAGHYYFLEELAGLEKILAQEFEGASLVAASQLKVNWRLNPSVAVVDASGYPVRTSAGVTVIEPGLLYAGQKKTFFITLKVPTETVQTFALGEATLTYSMKGRPHSENLLEKDTRIACLPPDKTDEVARSINKEVFEQSWTSNNYGSLLKSNSEKIKSGDRPGALKELSDFKARLSQADQMAPSAALKSKIGEVSKMEEEVNAAFDAPAPEEGLKRLNKAYQYEGIKSQRVVK